MSRIVEDSVAVHCGGRCHTQPKKIHGDQGIRIRVPWIAHNLGAAAPAVKKKKMAWGNSLQMSSGRHGLLCSAKDRALIRQSDPPLRAHHAVVTSPVVGCAAPITPNRGSDGQDFFFLFFPSPFSLFPFYFAGFQGKPISSAFPFGLIVAEPDRLTDVYVCRQHLRLESRLVVRVV